MFAEERKDIIYKTLLEKKRVTIKELTDILDVSGTTVRLYLSEMEESGKLIRTHGGAILIEDQPVSEDSIAARRGKYEREKQHIALLAKKCIEKGDAILIDAGTTGRELAKNLRDIKDITVFTNDLKIALEVQKNLDIDLVFLGGTIRNGYECSVGIHLTQMLEKYSIDKAFLGANAISILKGATTPKVETALAKEAMLKATKTRYLIADSSKLGKRALCTYAQLREFDYLITDNKILEEQKEELEQFGLTVIC